MTYDNRGSRSISGRSLELAVARIQKMLDPNSTVSHNEKLIDRVGNERQYDVVIRGRFGGQSMLGVIECKDHRKKKGPDSVEAFAKKTENLGANLRVMVSRTGFTEQALRLAKHENIGCFSLLPSDDNDVGFSIGDMWYGVLRQWKEFQFSLHFALPEPPISGFDGNMVRYEGKLVGNWLFKLLLTKFNEQVEPGKFEFTVQFDSAINLDVEGREWPVLAITCIAIQEHKKKRQWVRWTGDGLFDWHTRQATIPPDTTISGSFVPTDLSAWPDYDGPIPSASDATSGGFIRATLISRQAWNPDWDSETPNLDEK